MVDAEVIVQDQTTGLFGFWLELGTRPQRDADAGAAERLRHGEGCDG
jgi:hypothetical protein